MKQTGLYAMRALVAGAIAASLGPAAFAGQNTIDMALDACLASDHGQTTAGMIDCTQIAIKAWNARLNEDYQRAMATLDPRSRDLLRASERKWLAFRAAEQSTQAGPWHESRGNDITIEIMDDDLSAIRERARELSTYAPSG